MPCGDVRQYTSIAFGHGCTPPRSDPSIGSIGDAFDNTLAETRHGTTKAA